MTTVLIVDDEALAIQAIRRSINWKNLDVDRVLDAANGAEDPSPGTGTGSGL